MKKLFLSVAAAAMFAFFACGPSAEQLAEQARLDSIRIADSITAVQAAADSAAKAQVAADSAAAAQKVADSLAAIEAKGGKKTK